jgi:hypothetical protein
MFSSESRIENKQLVSRRGEDPSSKPSPYIQCLIPFKPIKKENFEYVHERRGRQKSYTVKSKTRKRFYETSCILRTNVPNEKFVWTINWPNEPVEHTSKLEFRNKNTDHNLLAL